MRGRAFGRARAGACCTSLAYVVFAAVVDDGVTGEGCVARTGGSGVGAGWDLDFRPRLPRALPMSSTCGQEIGRLRTFGQNARHGVGGERRASHLALCRGNAVADEVSQRFQLIGHRSIGLGITRQVAILRQILAG